MKMRNYHKRNGSQNYVLKTLFMLPSSVKSLPGTHINDYDFLKTGMSLCNASSYKSYTILIKKKMEKINVHVKRRNFVLYVQPSEDHLPLSLEQFVLKGFLPFVNIFSFLKQNLPPLFHCSLAQYWPRVWSFPGTWTGTETPGEIKPKAEKVGKLNALLSVKTAIKYK